MDNPMEIIGPVLFVVLAVLGGVYKFYWEPRGKSMLGRSIVDPWVGDPQARAIGPLVMQGNVGALAQLFATIGPNANARGFYLRVVGGKAPRAALDAWCAREPGNALAFLVRGRQSIEWAWEARGGGGASSVSDAQWALFRERIAMAEQDLLRAANLEPRDPTPFAELVRVALAKSDPPPVAWQHFQAAVSRDPDNYQAHKEMLAYLSSRWHGDHGQMMAFARQAAAAAAQRPGSDLPMLLVSAHLDEHNYRCLFEGNESSAIAYLHDPAVKHEILSAYHATLAGPCQPRHTTIYFRNEAAFAFFLWSDVGRLRTELQRMNGTFTAFPWNMQSTSADELVTAAKACAGM